MTGDGSGALAARMVQMPAVAHAIERERERGANPAVPSFDDVYAQHAPFVWRILRTFGVGDAHIEDAVQDVFVVVHRKLPEWEGRAQITTWLFAIARRVASTYRRRGSAHPTEELVVDPEGEADTFAAMSRAQAAATVVGILQQLDEDKRAVFALVELEQISVTEVARMLDINLNTAYSRLRLARAAFELAVRAQVKP
jgi:RNA polymerase sigma-70 factor, ECF subfamily